MYLKNLTNTPFGTSPEAFRGLPGLFQFWVPLPKAGKSAVVPGRTTDANQGKGAGRHRAAEEAKAGTAEKTKAAGQMTCRLPKSTRSRDRKYEYRQIRK